MTETKSELFSSIYLDVVIVPFTEELRWVENKRCHDGGYNRTFKVKKPLLSVCFKGTIKENVKRGEVYIGNGGCVFYAVSNNELVNLNVLVDHFIIPTEIIETSKPYSQ
ncbi:MAG: hypothetical protein PHS33_08195 [Candidatus Omnitrophica bacterium]|nr:hypothetical protein [Candidatus Omnitrophota bacterium]